MNCEVCIRKELYAECRVVGGTAVFQGLVEPMARDSVSSALQVRRLFPHICAVTCCHRFVSLLSVSVWHEFPLA